jgi:hypothetical protein
MVDYREAIDDCGVRTIGGEHEPNGGYQQMIAMIPFSRSSSERPNDAIDNGPACHLWQARSSQPQSSRNRALGKTESLRLHQKITKWCLEPVDFTSV